MKLKPVVVSKAFVLGLQFIMVGFFIALSLLLPTVLGYWADHKVTWGFPIFTILGLGLGILLMVYGVLAMIRPFLKEAEKLTKDLLEKYK